MAKIARPTTILSLQLASSNRCSFRYVNVFADMCVSLADYARREEDPSVTMMTSIQRLPRLQETPVIHGLFNLLKDMLFELQRIKFSDSSLQISLASSGYSSRYHSDTCILTDPETATNCEQETPTVEMFPDKVRDNLKCDLRDLQATVCDHRRAVMDLRKAQRVYLRQHKKLMRYHNNHLETINQTESKETSDWISWNSHVKHQLSSAKLERQTNKTNEAYAMLIASIPKEAKLRETGVEFLSHKLQDYIKARIFNVIEHAITQLLTIQDRLPISSELCDRLAQFDISDMASKIYKSLSTKYLTPLMDDFTFSVEVSEPRLMGPDLTLDDTQEIKLGRSNSSVCLLDDTTRDVRPGEQYVVANNDILSKKFQTQLTFKQGQHIKQKICSTDGTIGFGWTKRFTGIAGSPKQYGFYETYNTEHTSTS